MTPSEVTRSPTDPPQAGEGGKRCSLKLINGSRVGVIGGGPAGSFFSLFLLEMAQRAGLELELDLFEARDFSRLGPAGCNMCGGIISESLVQMLATEGITLPPTVIERGIDAYVLHMDVGVARIPTPLREMRIGTVHRGAGPRGLQATRWRSFDGYLLDLAAARGAHVNRARVEEVKSDGGLFEVKAHGGPPRVYDLLAVATGVNTGSHKLFASLGLPYRPPRTSRTYISEFYFGEADLNRYFGHSMHVFLLNLPRLEFAALIPKGDYLTFCLLGRDIDDKLVKAFFQSPEVQQCMPPGWERPDGHCHCSPSITVEGAREPFADRLVFVGDCGVSRLYKDGIGAAYRAAKAAAATAVFQGISREDFRRHYWPVCRALTSDNQIGKVIFAVTRFIQRERFARRGVLRMIRHEQRRATARPRMSMVLWDTFTGSRSYRNIFMRTLHPAYWGRLMWEIAIGLFSAGTPTSTTDQNMKSGILGKLYRDGETIVNQGDVGNSMFVVQQGQVQVLQARDGQEVPLATMGEGEVFGEMALFEREVRSATVRALGEACVLTVDRRLFFQRVHEDPSLAFRMLQTMSRRIRTLDAEVTKLKAGHEKVEA